MDENASGDGPSGMARCVPGEVAVGAKSPFPARRAPEFSKSLGGTVRYDEFVGGQNVETTGSAFPEGKP